MLSLVTKKENKSRKHLILEIALLFRAISNISSVKECGWAI